MTDRQRLTWQQTFFRRVKSLSTARWILSLLSEQWWRERSAEGVVIDLQVMQVWGRAVAGGFLDVWEARSRPGCQGPQRKYAGYLSTTSWKLKLSGSRNSRVIREMMRMEKKWMEVSKMQCANIWTRQNSQGTLTLTTKKGDYKNKQAQLWFNPQRPRVIGCTREFPHASGHSTCCWACRSVLHVTISIVVNAPNLFTFWPVREFLVEIHTAKMDL